MHELSIADAVLRIALTHADGRRVTRVHLKAGHLRQIVPAALGFAWELVARGTPAEGASLEIEAVAAAGACRWCGAESMLESFPLQCRSCGSPEVELVRGEELEVEWLEYDDPGTVPWERDPFASDQGEEGR